MAGVDTLVDPVRFTAGDGATTAWPYASVLVNVHGGSAASLFTDATLSKGLPNPLLAGSSGDVQFYVAPGDYDLVATAQTGQTLTTYVTVAVPNVGPVPAGTSVQVGSSTGPLTPASPGPVQLLGLGTTVGTTGATSQGYRNSLLQLLDKGTKSGNDALVSGDIVLLTAPSRTVTDGVVAGTSLTSVTGAFSSDDVGAPVSGANIPAARSVTDAVFTATSAVVTSASAAFVNAAYPAGDIGRPVSAGTAAPTTGGPLYSVIPSGTTILSVQSGTQATLSAAATNSATGFNLVIGGGVSIASVQSPTQATLNLAGVNGSGLTVTIADIIRTTGAHMKAYTPPDNGGDTSPFLGVQTGGGSGASFYKLAYLRPPGAADNSSSSQGAMECGTGDQAQAFLAMSGYNPASYLASGMSLMASNAVKVRLDSPVAKGLLVQPLDGNFDTRMALAVGNQVKNAVDTALTFSVTLAGTIQSKGAGQSTNQINTGGAVGGTLQLVDTNTSANNGGMALFGAGTSYGAAIKYLLQNNLNNSQGDLIVATRNATTDATLTERLRVKAAGDIVVNGSGTTLTATGHFVTSNVGTSTTVANGAGIGTTPGTPTVAGTDMAGQVTIVTGTGPTADGIMATVTFAHAFAANPRAVVFTPANAAAAAATPWTGAPGTDLNAATFNVRLHNPTASTTYVYNYEVMG